MDMRDSTVFGPMPSVSLPDRSSWQSGNDLAVIAVARNHRAVREEMLTRDSDIRAGVVRFSAAAAHHEGMREWLESKNFKVPEYSVGERLIDAAEGEHFPQIRRLLAAGADVNHRGESDWTPITKAATWGCPKAVKLLLKNNAHPNTLKHHHPALRLARLGGASSVRISQRKVHRNQSSMLSGKRKNQAVGRSSLR